MNYKLLFFIPFLMVIKSYGIEPIIVDYNKDQSITDHIDFQKSTCAIFGATPRYIMFENYLQTVRNDFSQLHAHYKRDKKLKNVHGSIKPIIHKLTQQPGLDRVEALLADTDLTHQLKLFFATGLSRTTLCENSKKLVDTIKKEKIPVLLHILMPSYFADLPEDKKRPELVAAFLAQAALLYQKTYSSIETDVQTCIVIPPVDHFMNITPQSDPCSANLAVVESIALPSVERAVLIDQNLEELQHMIKTLRADNFTTTRGVQLGLYNERGHLTTIFNPYILNPEKSAPYKNSPFINQTFADYVSTACTQEPL